MGQIKFLSSLLLFSLFVLAVVNFSFDFSSLNDSNTSLEQSGYYQNNLGINQSLIYFQEGADSKQSSFYQSIIAEGSDNLQSGGVFETTSYAINSTKNSIIAGQGAVTGGDQRFNIFFGVILGMIGIMAFLYVWKTWKSGDVE